MRLRLVLGQLQLQHIINRNKAYKYMLGIMYNKNENGLIRNAIDNVPLFICAASKGMMSRIKYCGIPRTLDHCLVCIFIFLN